MVCIDVKGITSLKFMHNESVLIFISCLSSIVTAVIGRGTGNIKNEQQQARSGSDRGNDITNH
jgi:hypothetical protein